MRRKWLRITLLVSLAILLMALILLASDILLFSSMSDNSPSDAAIVLGAAVWGNQPSPVFEERINHAIHLYQEGVVDNIIFTGGLAANDQLAEAEAARAYAIERGVSPEHVFIETKSYNTCLNLLEAKRIVEEKDWEQVLIVSDPLHMKRAMWLAESIGIKALSSPTPTSRYQSIASKTGFLLREIYFYGTYLLKINRCQ
jgi:uncharacterized SAM-binding protein YcdF (DUF218 family)